MAATTSPESPLPVRQVVSLIAGWVDRLGAVWISADIHEQFLNQLLRTREVRVENALPGMWEVRGGRQGLLAFEQGLGKTLVAIDSFRRLRERGDADRMLVICPNSLKRNWVAEIAKFAPGMTVDVAEGKPRDRRHVFASSSAAVVVTSYETARVDAARNADTTAGVDEMVGGSPTPRSP